MRRAPRRGSASRSRRSVDRSRLGSVGVRSADAGRARLAGATELGERSLGRLLGRLATAFGAAQLGCSVSSPASAWRDQRGQLLLPTLGSGQPQHRPPRRAARAPPPTPSLRQELGVALDGARGRRASALAGSFGNFRNGFSSAGNGSGGRSFDPGGGDADGELEGAEHDDVRSGISSPSAIGRHDGECTAASIAAPSWSMREHLGVAVGRAVAAATLGAGDGAHRRHGRPAARQPRGPRPGCERSVDRSAARLGVRPAERAGAAGPRCRRAAPSTSPAASAATSIATRPTLNTTSSNGTGRAERSTRLVGLGDERRDPHHDRRIERERHAARPGRRRWPPRRRTATRPRCRRGPPARSATASTSAAIGVARHVVADGVAHAPARAPPTRTAPLKPEAAPDGNRRSAPTASPSPPRRAERDRSPDGARRSARALGHVGPPTPTEPTSAYSVSAMPSASKPGPRLADDAGTRTITQSRLVRRPPATPRRNVRAWRPPRRSRSTRRPSRCPRRAMAARSATTSAAPALSTTMLRCAPWSPASTRRTASAFSAGSPPVSSSGMAGARPSSTGSTVKLRT